MRKLIILEHGRTLSIIFFFFFAFENDFLVSKLEKCSDLKTFQSLSK